MNIDTALEKIYSLKQFHIKLGLENIFELLHHIGNPEKNLKIIHVAGSNGKGSTCSFLSSILQEYGFQVGLYTSPHFVRFNERIRINGQEISDDTIINFLEANKKYIEEKSPTFFEITTALAYAYFENSKVDYAIIETGLGGRLDATNTIIPLASVITSISLEHCHILGDTLSKIAFEKAGIIKNNTPVFIGDLPSEAENTISEICKERNCELLKLNEFAKIDNNKYEIDLNSDKMIISETGLNGNYQLKNASLAIKVICSTIGLNDVELFHKAIDNVVLNTGIQGRYERSGKNSNIIFDAAHNPEGIEIFFNEFLKEFQLYKSCTLIFGAMKDKDIAQMLSKISPLFSKIYVTATNYDRAATPEEISIIAEKNNIVTEIHKQPEQIVKDFENKSKDECLVVIGSIYLIGQIKQKLQLKN
jgi:dihydrofolate synthase/folylpolyglutamate synthase